MAGEQAAGGGHDAFAVAFGVGAQPRSGLLAGRLRGVGGAGRIATAPRKEFAEAAAVVLSTPGHEGRAYELSGDVAWSFDEFATTAQELLGTPVRYQSLTSENEREQLLALGLDEGTADFMVMLNADMRDGAMAATPGDLARLIGRPAEPLAETMKTWL
ncbi:hypothetical protein [Nonomuraea sp. NPDC050202]|uniref:hypothetical protein n=1 Tax=Nonomuraea sp. NPDC050202 TaxID=3155035 RepID=UPI0033CE0C10